MSMDKLEKFVRENRVVFDDKEPPADVWHNINDQLENSERPTVSIGSYLWRAAAIVLFAAVVWLMVDRSDRNDSSAMSEGFLNENEIAFNDVDKDLLVEIDQLDSSYQMLKTAADEGHSEKIIDAMVLNLQMRIDILNQQLEVLEKIKKIKENEKVSI